VIDFLRGSKSDKIREEHKALKTYGVGADISKADWMRYLRELVALGYLAITDDGYYILKLTPKSDAVLKGQQKVELIASQIEEEQEHQALPFDEALLNLIKNTRRDIAQQENVPAYIIVSDATLVEMATYLPQSLDELRLISGFGDIKLARYGREFLATVTSYCKQQGLSSKMDQKSRKRERKNRAPKAAKPVAMRSNDTKLASLNSYRSGKSIAEIAAERGFTVSTIETHLSHFVQSGEMNISEIVTDDKLPTIKDAIEKYGADRLAPLKEILGNDFSYGEIKAVIGWINRNQ
jgi:ATP-dependent DNA helicase RecQ